MKKRGSDKLKVMWMGIHHRVTTKAGGFVRGVPRELTPEAASLLNLDDPRFVVISDAPDAKEVTAPERELEES